MYRRNIETQKERKIEEVGVVSLSDTERQPQEQEKDRELTRISLLTGR